MSEALSYVEVRGNCPKDAVFSCDPENESRCKPDVLEVISAGYW